MEAGDKAIPPWYTVMETVKKLLSGGEDRKVSIQLLLSLSPPLERGMSEEAAQNKESLLTQLGPRSLQFLLQTASLSLDLKLVWDNPAIQDRTCADIPRDFHRACKEKSDTSILHLLSFVFNYKSMVQIAEGCLHRGGGEGNVKAVPVADKSCSSCPWCRTPIWGCWPGVPCPTLTSSSRTASPSSSSWDSIYSKWSCAEAWKREVRNASLAGWVQ